MSKWICILGFECHCAHEHGKIDQFCVNSRRVKKKGDDHEEASQEEKAILPALQATQNWRL